MDSRRKFLGRVAGLAGTLAVPSSVLGANDRIRVGIIGVGARGSELVRQAMACPGVEFVAFADVYTRRLEEAKQIAPEAATYLDHRRLLDDQSDRCHDYRNATTSALRALRQRLIRRQACLSGKNDGFYGGSCKKDACRL